jgi:hypothetical protein
MPSCFQPLSKAVLSWSGRWESNPHRQLGRKGISYDVRGQETTSTLRAVPRKGAARVFHQPLAQQCLPLETISDG